MIYIDNRTEGAIVLKALNCSTIRLYPGFNEIDVDDKYKLEPYFTDRVNKSLISGYKKLVIDYEKKDINSAQIDNYNNVTHSVRVKPCLVFVDYELDEDEKRKAFYAKENNYKLNKDLSTTVKANIKQIAKEEQTITEQQKQIDELKESVELLTKKLSKKG